MLDLWVASSSCFVPRPGNPNLVRDALLTVSDLLIPNSRLWNESLIQQLFLPEDVDSSLNLHLPSSSRNDMLRWVADPRSHFSLKSAYGLSSPLLTLFLLLFGRFSTRSLCKIVCSCYYGKLLGMLCLAE